jgi:hypothetical protein
MASASRGAAIAVAVAVVFMVVSAPGRLRLVFLLTAPLVVFLAVFLIPRHALQRILSFSSTTENASEEALESSQIRERLFLDSVKDTIAHPLFGVGPGQFSENEGKERLSVNGPGLWYQTHNSLTQIASECGIPALILYLLAIGSAFQLLGRNGRRVRGVPQLADTVFELRICLLPAGDVGDSDHSGSSDHGCTRRIGAHAGRQRGTELSAPPAAGPPLAPTSG